MPCWACGKAFAFVAHQHHGTLNWCPDTIALTEERDSLSVGGELGVEILSQLDVTSGRKVVAVLASVPGAPRQFHMHSCFCYCLWSGKRGLCALGAYVHCICVTSFSPSCFPQIYGADFIMKAFCMKSCALVSCIYAPELAA